MTIEVVSLIVLAMTVSQSPMIEAEPMTSLSFEPRIDADDQRSEARRTSEGWDLHAWRADLPDGEWRFALRARTTLVKDAEAIRRDPLHGIEALRDAVATLAEGEWVTIHVPDADQNVRDLLPRLQEILAEARVHVLLHGVPRRFRSKNAQPIELDDPIWPALQAHQHDIAAKYAEGRVIVPHFGPWYEIGHCAAAELFANRRFAAIVYDHHLHPDAERVVHRAAGLRSIVVLDRETNETVHTLRGLHVNVEQFGALLAHDRITIDSVDDANAVWAAYRDLCASRNRSSEPKQVSGGVWQVDAVHHERTLAHTDGVRTVVTRTHITEILTDPTTNRVLSARTRIETGDRREIPADSTR